jgi:hypothetical protein
MQIKIPGKSPITINASGGMFVSVPGGGPVSVNKPGLKYLLNDTFTTALAAGSVNGTVPSPRGTNRKVRDLDTVLQVASNWVEWAAQTDGSPGYARQDLVYNLDPITRQAGQIVMCKWRTSEGDNKPHYPLALVKSQTPSWASYADVIHGFYRSAALTMSSVDNEAAGVPLFPFAADGTVYWLVMVLQATGCYYFVQGGAFTNLTFCRFSTVGAATPLYVASSGYTAVFSTTNYRVPQPLYSGDLVAGS